MLLVHVVFVVALVPHDCSLNAQKRDPGTVGEPGHSCQAVCLRSPVQLRHIAITAAVTQIIPESPGTRTAPAATQIIASMPWRPRTPKVEAFRGLPSLLQCVTDHRTAGLDADRAVGVSASALDANAGIHNLLQNAPIDDAAVVETHKLRVCDRVVLVGLEQEEIRVLRRA